MDKENALKLSVVFTIPIFQLFIVYYMLTTPPADKYELSIYSAYPLVFWASFVALVALLGFTLLSNCMKPKIKLLSILLILSLYVLLLSLPIARGYFIPERYDILEHIGRIKDILFRGRLSPTNFYPAMHILAMEIIDIADIDVYSSIMYLPLIIYPLFVPFVYIVAKQINPRNNWYLSAVALLAILHISSPYLVPSVVSYILAILVLGIWLSQIQYLKKVVLVLLLYVSIIFMHPLTSMYLLFILLLTDLVGLISPEDYRIWDSKAYKLSPAIVVIWLTWYFSFHKILTNFKMFISSLVKLTGNEIFARGYLGPAQHYNLTFLEIAQIAAFKYGEMLLSISMGSFIFLASITKAILLKSKSHIQKLAEPRAFLLNIWLGSFLIWTALNFNVHFVHPDRVFKYLYFFSILLIPLHIMPYYSKKKSTIYAKMFLGTVIWVMVVLSIFSMYPSPLSKVENRQVTQSEFTAWGFLFENRDNHLLIRDDTKTTQRRFYVAWYGKIALLDSKNILHYGDERARIPDHFGYDTVPFVGYQYTKPTYYVVSGIIKLLYPKVLPDKEERWRWHPEDFIKLEIDPTVNAIYRTQGISIYFVLPKMEKGV